jgi:EAL domain-containing protein (putative c-di-GMP-specific phosphodiesterase class I)
MGAAMLRKPFDLDYQPLISVGGGETVGVEALLRWDTGAGRIPPAELIGFLDAEDPMATVDAWVLSRAARQGAAWDREGQRLLMSVSVSAPVLPGGYAATVLETLAREGFPPERLCLGLTWTASLAGRSIAAGAELRRLKTAGVRLFLDSFGTSAASVADLKRCGVDAVKIDRSFVAGLGQPDQDAIVAALINLAHALRLRTIAERVETETQLVRLREFGCDLACYMRNTPNPRRPSTGAEWAADSPTPSTSRVWRGSMIPSS